MRKLATLVVAGAALLAVPQAHAQDDPAVAPATTLSDAGRTASGAGRSLSASQVDALDPGGQSVTVSGTGYDANKGVYVTFCAIPPTNHPPSPCGGGQDRTGSSGASGWISSNPPDYASGLTTPYGPGGSFTVELAIQPALNDTVDCRSVRCAIVTRNDHTRGTDRSQDLFLPVTFRSPGEPAPSGPAATLPPPTTTTTIAVVDPSAVAPATTLSAAGDTVSDGARSVRASAVRDLDPDGTGVTVTGAGFDPAQGIYVALCQVPVPPASPGPCSVGRATSSWISSNPPDYGADLAIPFGAGGTFEVELALAAEIDEATDCREVACAVTTRSDDTAPTDRRHDLLLPVEFADEVQDSPADETESGSLVVASDGESGGDLPVAGIAGGGAVLAAVAGALVVRTRRRRPDGSDPS